MLLPVLNFPDARLRKKAKPVVSVDNKVKKLVADMFETMYFENGIGLAATQVDYHYQIIIMDVPDDEKYQELIEKRQNTKQSMITKNDQFCFINPKLLNYSGSTECIEGCLSVPGFQAKINRREKITVAALDRNGKYFELDADGLLAICIQHEMDHLQGKLFIDYLSKLKQQLIKEKLIKLTKVN